MTILRALVKPKASEVLTAYLKQTGEPPWTSYFVKLKDVENDQHGMSHFNWTLDSGANYHILRAGCYPYLKYHCSKRPYQDLRLEDTFFRFLKIINLGLPLLFYGIAATQLIKHTEIVDVNGHKIQIFFLYKEDKGSMY
uniref:Uncharacterized protein n=1 Tax=Tabanus bromius TaxID=304241 RepID=A0A0K8TLP7_TABBR